MNQTTIPPASQSNPGTIDQRTPTTTNPTQLSTGSPTQMGTSTIDQQPMQRSTTINQQSVEQRTGAATTQPMNTGVNQRRQTNTQQRPTNTATPRP